MKIPFMENRHSSRTPGETGHFFSSVMPVMHGIRISASQFPQAPQAE
jgi:hypothetical protein